MLSSFISHSFSKYSVDILSLRRYGVFLCAVILFRSVRRYFVKILSIETGSCDVESDNEFKRFVYGIISRTVRIGRMQMLFFHVKKRRS